MEICIVCIILTIKMLCFHMFDIALLYFFSPEWTLFQFPRYQLLCIVKASFNVMPNLHLKLFSLLLLFVHVVLDAVKTSFKINIDRCIIVQIWVLYRLCKGCWLLCQALCLKSRHPFVFVQGNNKRIVEIENHMIMRHAVVEDSRNFNHDEKSATWAPSCLLSESPCKLRFFHHEPSTTCPVGSYPTCGVL